MENPDNSEKTVCIEEEDVRTCRWCGCVSHPWNECDDCGHDLGGES